MDTGQLNNSGMEACGPSAKFLLRLLAVAQHSHNGGKYFQQKLFFLYLQPLSTSAAPITVGAGGPKHGTDNNNMRLM